MDKARSVERPYGWVVLVASLALMTIAAGSYYVVIVALKPIAAEFGGPRWVPSLAYGLAIFGMGAGGIFMGLWADRTRVAWPALMGTAALVLGAWLASISTTRWEFWLVHLVLIGLIGNGAAFTPLVANATHWFDRRRGLAVAIVAAGQGLAGAVWPIVFHALVEAHGWRGTLVIYAAFAAVTLVPLSLLLLPRAPAPSEGVGSVAGYDGRPLGLHARRIMVMLSLAIVACCVAMAMPMVHVIAHATDLGFTGRQGALMLTLLLGSAFVSRIVWGAVSDRIGGLPTLVSASLCQAVMLSAFIVVDSLAGLYTVSVLFGLGFGGIVPAYTIIVRELYPANQIGWRMGVIYMFSTAGMALGGWMAGAIFDATAGYTLAFVIGVAFNIGNLMLVTPLLVRQRRFAVAAAAS